MLHRTRVYIRGVTHRICAYGGSLNGRGIILTQSTRAGLENNQKNILPGDCGLLAVWGESFEFVGVGKLREMMDIALNSEPKPPKTLSQCKCA